MNNQKKYRLFVISIPVILIMVYQLALKPTFLEYKRHSNSIDISRSIEQFPAQLTEASVKLAQADKTLGIDTNGEFVSSIDVLDQVTKLCSKHSVILTEMPPRKQVADNNVLIGVYELTLSGMFKNLLQVLFSIESLPHFARVVSLDFYSVRVPNGENQLLCKAYLHSYTINKE